MSPSTPGSMPVSRMAINTPRPSYVGWAARNWSTPVLLSGISPDIRATGGGSAGAAGGRSEEHTSELQSRLHLVCRLLLEKKNNRYYLYHEIGRSVKPSRIRFHKIVVAQVFSRLHLAACTPCAV